MSSSAAKSKSSKGTTKPTAGRLFVLDLSDGRVLSCNPDGSDLKTIVSEGRRLPDGIVVDVEARHIYWTNMGSLKENDGSIERADLDGKNLKHIVPPGGTFTPKQLQLDKKNGKLYWCDREGMRVMRCNLDGSKIETLIDSSQGDLAPGRTQPSGASASLSILTQQSSTGLRKVQTMPVGAASSAPILKSRRVRRRRTAKISRCSMKICPNP